MVGFFRDRAGQGTGNRRTGKRKQKDREQKNSDQTRNGVLLKKENYRPAAGNGSVNALHILTVIQLRVQYRRQALDRIVSKLKYHKNCIAQIVLSAKESYCFYKALTTSDLLPLKKSPVPLTPINRILYSVQWT